MSKITYRLKTEEYPPVSYIPAKHTKHVSLMLLDENGKRREARYCANEPSIWKDEQNKDSKPTHVKFRDGVLQVDEADEALIFLLDNHPKKGLYERVDLAKEAKEANAQKELQIEAEYLVSKAKVKEIQDLGKVYFPALDTDVPVEIIKQRLYERAKADPESVIRNLSTPTAKEENDVMALVNEALTKEIVMEAEDKKAVVWGDSQEVIVEKAHNKKPENALFEFLNKEEGSVVLAEIKARLS